MSRSPTQSRSLGISDLQSGETNSPSTANYREFVHSRELRDSDFAADCASTARQIGAARNDLESLMMKSYGLIRNSGLDSGPVTLPRVSPRHIRNKI
jgi:hypothetical protein